MERRGVQPAAGLGDRPPEGLPGAGRVGAFRGGADQGPRTGVGLEAAPGAAGALRAVGIEDHVADLARAVVGAGQDAAVDHHRAAHAGAQGDHHQIRIAASGAQTGLADQGGVDVVGHDNGQVAECPAHGVRQAVALPAGQVRRAAQSAGAGRDDAGAGQAHAGEDDPGGGLAHRGREPRQCAVDPGGIGADFSADQGLAGRVGHRELHGRAADVGAQGVAVPAH